MHPNTARCPDPLWPDAQPEERLNEAGKPFSDTRRVNACRRAEINKGNPSECCCCEERRNVLFHWVLTKPCPPSSRSRRSLDVYVLASFPPTKVCCRRQRRDPAAREAALLWSGRLGQPGCPRPRSSTAQELVLTTAPLKRPSGGAGRRAPPRNRAVPCPTPTHVFFSSSSDPSNQGMDGIHPSIAGRARRGGRC